MVCCPCQAVGTQSEAVYERRMVGAGISYQDINRVRVQCSECGEEMAMGLMAVHQQTNHKNAEGGGRNWVTTPPGGEPRTYKMYFPTVGWERNCSVEGCQGRSDMRTAIRVHFLHWHVRVTVIILEEGNLPHPWCPWYDMLLTCKDLNRRHITISQCDKGA